MNSDLLKYTYTWRGTEITVYAEDDLYADAIMAKVLIKVEPRPEVEYRETRSQYIYFQTKP